MKSLFPSCLLFFALRASIFSFGQSTWFEQNTGLGEYLTDVEFINENIGYAIGEGGKVIKTTDGGTTWTQQNISTTALLYDSYFLTDQKGWICTSEGYVFKTTDGGTNWIGVGVLSSGSLIAIDFISATTGFVVGDNFTSGFVEIYKTADAGSSWSAINPPLGMSSVLDIEFIDDLKGFVLDYYDLYYTSDGGLSWVLISDISGSIQLSRIEMLDSQIGWITGVNGVIFKTTNGGLNWLQQTSPVTSALWGISIIDMNNVFVAGQNGTIISTADGGANWVVHSVPTIVELAAVSAVNLEAAWTCGENGKIYRINTDNTDLEIISFQGQSTVCANNNFPVEIVVKNNGVVPITSMNFVVLDGITPKITTVWNGNISPGGTELINLGAMSISAATILTIALDGDSVTDNNTFFQSMSVYGEGAVGANGPLNACVGEALTLFGYGGLSYYWLNATPDSSSQTQHLFATQSTVYFVEITTTNCVVHDSVIVTVNDGDCITNAFSPNNDGVNDLFFIDGLSSSAENTVTIFTRWGDEIISIKNYDNVTSYWTGLDGLGNELIEGSYYYVVDSPAGNSFAGTVYIGR